MVAKSNEKPLDDKPRRKKKKKKKKKRRSKKPAQQKSKAPSGSAGHLDDGDDGPKTVTDKPLGPETDKDFRKGLLIVAVAVVIFYGSTVSRWIGLGDTALVLDEMVNLKVNSHVNNHTIAIIFGWLFSKLPFGELALRVNLMSTFFGSIAIVLMYMVAHRTLRKWWLAVFASAMVAVMHSMWWHATIIENYAINAVTLLGVMLCLLKDEERTDNRYYYVACVIAGIAIVNHVQMATLSVAVFVYAILARKKGPYGLIKRWAKMTGYFFVGFTPYLIILVNDMMKADAKNILFWATGGDFQSRMFDFSLGKVFRPLVIEFIVQFPSPIWILVAIGVYWIGEKAWYARANVSITVIFLINTFFFAQFHTWDKFAFLLPSFLIVAYWGIVGIRASLDWMAEDEDKRGKLRNVLYGVMGFCVLWPPFFYRQLPKWGADEGMWHKRFNNNYTFNTHDCSTYIANPDKSGWDDVDRFAKALFDKLPEKAVFFDDDSRIYYPLNYYFQRQLGYRRDVSVIMMNSWGFKNWGLSEDRFIAQARRWVIQKERRVFIITIEDPMRAIVARLAEVGVVAKRFDIDENVWIYELVGEDDGILRVHDVQLGRGWNQPTPVQKNSFEVNESIAARVRFAKTADPVEVQFIWNDPDGKEHFASEPFTIQAGNVDVWSHMEDTKPRKPGTWTVTLQADTQSVASQPFIISG